MTQLQGTYFNGKLQLNEVVSTEHPVRVTVIFEEDVEATSKALNLTDFGFLKTQKMLKNVTASFSDAVINERHKAR